MLSKRVVEVASAPLLWRSRLFTVQDTDMLRFILGLHVLFRYVVCPHFKVLTLGM